MDKQEPDAEGLAAARRLAGWQIGDASWADLIIQAYLDPKATNERLDADNVPQVTGFRAW